jgi:hypothetical protein
VGAARRDLPPFSIRARALGVAAAARWIANLIVTITFRKLEDADRLLDSR